VKGWKLTLVIVSASPLLVAAFMIASNVGFFDNVSYINAIK
jgi:hypothetical protein